MSEQNEILPFEPSQIKQSVDRFSGELTQYLDYLGLPTKNVLVDVSERRKVIANLPVVTDEVQYTKTLVMCKIGNGYGVSRQAEPSYDSHFKILLKLIGGHREFQSRLQFASCRTNLRELADNLSTSTTNSLIKRAMRLIADADAIGSIWLTGDYRRALKALNTLDA
jgi:hypothetical protein